MYGAVIYIPIVHTRSRIFGLQPRVENDCMSRELVNNISSTSLQKVDRSLVYIKSVLVSGPLVGQGPNESHRIVVLF